MSTLDQFYQLRKQYESLEKVYINHPNFLTFRTSASPTEVKTILNVEKIFKNTGVKLELQMFEREGTTTCYLINYSELLAVNENVGHNIFKMMKTLTEMKINEPEIPEMPSSSAIESSGPAEEYPSLDDDDIYDDMPDNFDAMDALSDIDLDELEEVDLDEISTEIKTFILNYIKTHDPVTQGELQYYALPKMHQACVASGQNIEFELFLEYVEQSCETNDYMVNEEADPPILMVI